MTNEEQIALFRKIEDADLGHEKTFEVQTMAVFWIWDKKRIAQGKARIGEVDEAELLAGNV